MLLLPFSKTIILLNNNNITKITWYDNLLLRDDVRVIMDFLGNRHFSRHLLAQSQRWKHQNNVQHMFKMDLEAPEWRHWCRTRVFIVNPEQGFYIALVLSHLLWTKRYRLGCKNLGIDLQRGLEFSIYKIKLRNWVTQSDVNLWVTNSKSYIVIIFFELIIRLCKTLDFFRVTNSKRKIRSFPSSY